MSTVAVDHIARPEPADDARGSSRWRRVVRGRESDPRWVRPTLLALLAGTALLYLIGLGASGWGNSFYSAAVQAGSSSWKAFFFGSFDSSNFITVDKPPASLWVMELSARLFGVNAWSILVPQAIAGVAAVGLLYATLRRHFGATAGLIAGAVLATTPVATLMFRFNNPDALLVLLLVAAAYAVTRAVESTRTRWLVLAGVLVGFGFLTKMLQAFLVVPGFGLAYLVYAGTSLRRRIAQLAAAAAALVLAGGWWVAAVMMTPASARPYVGGSTNNSVLQLAFGYNGFGRLTGNETGSVGGGGGGGGGMWGSTGITRLFGSDMAGEISWLIPAALLLGAGAWWALRTRRDDGTARRAQLLVWGSWLLVTGVVFSFSKGIIHAYYTVALAPAVGALVGIGAVTLWRARNQQWSRVGLALAVTTTAVWSYRLLNRTPSWHPALRAAILVVGVLVAVAVLLPPGQLSRLPARAGGGVAALGLMVGLSGPAAYSLATATSPHDGAIPAAGPAVAALQVFGPGGGHGGPGGLPGGAPPPGAPSQLGFGAPPQFGGRTASGFPGGAPAGGAGGLLNAGNVSSVLASALRTNASSYTWVAATVGAESASGYQLATDEPVMAIGGFNGTDNAPTLAQFKAYVAAGKIHYFIGGGGFGGIGGVGRSGGNSSSQITQWVTANYVARTVGGTTVYDLTASSRS